MSRRILLVIVVCVVLGGCRQPLGSSPYYNAQSGVGSDVDPRYASQFSELSHQIQDLNGRLSRFDADNNDLHSQVATLQQQLQIAKDYNLQLKQQLADTATQLQQLHAAKQSVEQQLANVSSGPSAQLAGSATLRANNSLVAKLSSIQIEGVTANMDGDVLRVEIPTDRLFTAGTYQINTVHASMLNDLASKIRQHFPRQIVGIEAHWDNTPIQPAGLSHHQLTATQALAVYDYLTRSGVPAAQLFTMSMGSNRPRYPAAAGTGGVSRNRRIEIVIYPETYDGI